MRSGNLHVLRHAILGALVPLAGCTPIEQPADPNPVGQPKPAKQAPPSNPETPAAPPVCAGDREIINDRDQPTGYSICGDGSVHRSQAVACQIPPILPNACPSGPSQGKCRTDAQCTAEPNGRCIAYDQNFRGTGTVYCGCHYACESDNDCGADEACLCTGAVSYRDGKKDTRLPRCVPAECRTDTDCGAAGECGAAIYNNGCSEQVTLACREEGDACRNHSECKDQKSCVATAHNSGSELRYDWQCSGMSCMIGRPFLVAGEARVADTRCSPSQAATSPDPAMAAHWQKIGRLEHASVASFARFLNQLLALGAPPELLAQTRAALSDEIRHTKLCLQMAAQFGARVSLGKFNLGGAQAARVSRVTVARHLFAEACLGETVGVAQALESGSASTDPASVRVYTQIARDELRHAQLAWQALRWLLDSATAEERGQIVAVTRGLLEATERQVERERPQQRGLKRLEFGLLGPAAERETWRETLREVIRPSFEAIVSRPVAHLHA
ncbi:MAG: ferritin-like domain-containing protein [Nannocystaceae bacterium]